MSIQKPPFFFRNRRRTMIIIIIFLFASLLVAALFLNQLQTYSQNTVGASNIEPQSFSVDPGALLNVKEQQGNISVYPSNTSTITVTPRKGGTVVAPDAGSVHILYNRTTNAQGRDQVSVSTDPWFSNTDFSIAVPSTTFVQIAVTAGSIDVHAGSGLTASTRSGGIALENIQGPTSVHTDSGDVTASTIAGSLEITDTSGSLRMDGINGQVNARTWSGDITVRASTLKGTSRLQTQNGSVHFDGSIDPLGRCSMQTTNGDVDLTLPGNAAFLLNASTDSGEVSNAFGTNVTGTGPRTQLSLHTRRGSITLVKAVVDSNGISIPWIFDELLSSQF